ncbi:MAG: sigma-70 family RNA polymerase sigma factor [Acidimicrobiales bacterium]
MADPVRGTDKLGETGVSIRSIGSTRGSGSTGLMESPAIEAADEAGLHAVFVSHGGELFGFARRSLGDSGLAEEAVQETFMRAWRSRHRFNPELGTLRGWLFAIERRVLIDLAHKRTATEADELVNDPVFLENQVEQSMLGWQVEEALRRLRPEHKSVIQDFYFANLPGKEVAARHGVPEGTVRSRLFYALRSLRLILEEMGWEQ